MNGEDFIRAGHIIQNAADIMKQAANTIDNAVESQRRNMEDWLQRFENILQESKCKEK